MKCGFLKSFEGDKLHINANLIKIKKFDSLRKFAIITKTITVRSISNKIVI